MTGVAAVGGEGGKGGMVGKAEFAQQQGGRKVWAGDGRQRGLQAGW